MHKNTHDNKFIITLKIADILCSFAYTNNFESPRFTFCRREFFIVSAATQNSIESLYLGTNANAVKQHNTGKYYLTERESNSRFSSFMSFSLLSFRNIPSKYPTCSEILKISFLLMEFHNTSPRPVLAF